MAAATVTVAQDPNTAQKRIYRKDGTPLHVRIYDDPSFGDRFTVVFTRRLKNRRGDPYYAGLSMNGLGMYHWLEFPQRPDLPRYSHLGKRVRFDSLNPDIQQAILSNYRSLYESRS